MMEEVREYIDIVFDQYEMTDEIKALRDEIVMDAEEHYRDCLAKGMSEKEAASVVKQSLGDLGGMLREIGAEKIEEEGMEDFYNAGKTLRNALERLFSDRSSKTRTVTITDVDSVDISGINMDVVLEQGSTDVVNVSIQDADAVEISKDGQTLVIRESGNRHFSGPRVKLEVPELKDMRMVLVSGDIRAKGITVGTMYCKTTSGDVTLDKITCERCELHSISGDVDIDKGRYETVEITSKSGDVDISTEEISICEISTVSGDQDVRIGWFAKMDLSAVSGDIDVRFEDDEDLIVDAGTVSGDCEIRGVDAYRKDGSRILNAGTVSGDVEIEKDR